MVQISFLTALSDPTINLEGLRLQRFEVCNWGTFQNYLWQLSPLGGSSVLTGVNGSGKTTLVDGLQCLIAPHKRRFNMASGSEKRSDRDLRSYIRGAWGKQKDQESNRSKARYLREPGVYSFLNAVFHNTGEKQTFSLAQILWVDQQEVKRYYLFAPFALSIQKDLALKGTPREWLKSLRQQNIEIWEESHRFIHRFKQAAYFRSEKALDLFVQTIALKEITQLNDFVRDHMLEAHNAQEQIQQLQISFENLTKSYDAIQLAEKQLELLKPLIKDIQTYYERAQRIQDTEASPDFIPAFLARYQSPLLLARIQHAAEKLEELTLKQTNATTLQQSLTDSIINLRLTIKNDDLGRQISDLQSQINRTNTELQQRQRQARKFDDLAQQLALPLYKDHPTFLQTRQEALGLQQSLQEQLKQLAEHLYKQRQQHDAIVESTRLFVEERDSLRQRSSQIPTDIYQLRAQLLQTLQFSEAEIPFVGELLRIQSDQHPWEAAVERLLHSFALRLLVPNHLYEAVSVYTNKTDLRGRLVYHRLHNRSTRTSETPDSRALFWKMEIKPDTPFTPWLETELLENWNYLCCETLPEFQKATRALTYEGQIKHGLSRHEKDDRSRLGDRTRYVLGWSNKAKIDALTQQIETMMSTITASSKTINTLIQQQKHLQHQADNANAFLKSFDDFSLLDWRPLQEQQRSQEQQLGLLLGKSNHLKTLQEELAKAEKQHKDNSNEINKLSKDITLLAENQRRDKQDEENAQRLLRAKAILPNLLPVLEKGLKDIQGREHIQIALPAFPELERQLYRYFINSKQALQHKQNTLTEEIIKSMTEVRNTNANLKRDYDASLEAADSYEKLYKQIQDDDLPQYKQKFKHLLNQKIIEAIILFHSKLKEQEADIKDSIQQLNVSLSEIAYTETTYIQLHCEPVHDLEIHDFRQQLRNCAPDVGMRQSPEANEQSFQRISALLKRFASEERWTNKVTDVRRWLDFSVSEINQETKIQQQYYSDSSGRSGGQKVKLAYTILASAIAHQYGLDQHNLASKAFRFIIVDEAFSRIDEKNARYAMELFRQLGLQVLIVTPMDKLQVVEPYIGACHFVQNNEEENNSQVSNLTYDEYTEQKELWQQMESK